MAQQHVPKGKHSPQNQPNARPASATQTGPVGLPEELFGDFLSGTVQTQANRLGDPRLKGAQKQALASHIGQVQGNKHLQRVMDAYSQPATKSAAFGKTGLLQRHAIPQGRQGVGEEEDEIQAQREEQVAQRHAIPQGRQGVGEEEDEIQTRPMVQRSPAFGQTIAGQGSPARFLWGNSRLPAVQRQKGKTKAPPKGATPKGAPAAKKAVKADDPAVKQAEKEYNKFVSGGPYKSNNYVPDTVDNFGKFDVVYDPANKLLSANMRVKFVFPDMPIPKGKTLVDLALAPVIKSIQDSYVTNFIKHVTTGWSGKFDFRNVREPQSVWGKLNPIRVKVDVQPVKSNQHYTFNKYFTPQIDKKTGQGKVPNVESNFTGNVHMYLFDTTKRGFTGSASIGKEEVVRLQRNLPKIRFASGSAAIDPKYIPDLQFVADYLRRMNRPKFIIGVVGHANKTGKEPENIKFSNMRAQAVMNKLKAFGVNNHTLTASGVGSTGATPDGSWRKVDFAISVDKSFSNVQDVDMHEFGHMLGLDDEYDRGDARTHTTQHKMKVLQKMLGSKGYGKGKADKYADEIAKIYKEGSAGVMHAGDEVRVYNYVTFWQALTDTATKAGNQPTPAFTWEDWKVTG